MHPDRFDNVLRLLASTKSRRSLLKALVASGMTGAIAAARQNSALAKPPADKEKVEICVWDADSAQYTPTFLPPAAADALVDHDKALYPVQNSDDPCAFPCGPQCLLCPQLPSHTCTICVDGECTCPPCDIWAMSFQGGWDGTVPLLGTKYQMFNYDESTQTIGSIPLSDIKEVTDATGIVVFADFPGDGEFCVKEVETPAGYTVLHADFACLHLGCGGFVAYDFHHEP
jgi:hypothetical protein